MPSKRKASPSKKASRKRQLVSRIRSRRRRQQSPPPPLASSPRIRKRRSQPASPSVTIFQPRYRPVTRYVPYPVSYSAPAPDVLILKARPTATGTAAALPTAALPTAASPAVLPAIPRTASSALPARAAAVPLPAAFPAIPQSSEDLARALASKEPISQADLEAGILAERSRGRPGSSAGQDQPGSSAGNPVDRALLAEKAEERRDSGENGRAPREVAKPRQEDEEEDLR